MTFYSKWWKQIYRNVDPISSRSMDNHLFLSGLWNFAEENNIGLQTLVCNDQKWSIFIRSFGSTSTIETSKFQVNLIGIYLNHLTACLILSRFVWFHCNNTSCWYTSEKWFFMFLYVKKVSMMSSSDRFTNLEIYDFFSRSWATVS